MAAKIISTEDRIVKCLRKKPKTLHEIAEEMDVPYQKLSRKVSRVVAEGRAKKHVEKNSLTGYSKP